MFAVFQRFNQLDANALPAVPTQPNGPYDLGIKGFATESSSYGASSSFSTSTSTPSAGTIAAAGILLPARQSAIA